jgi:ribosomal protein L35
VFIQEAGASVFTCSKTSQHVNNLISANYSSHLLESQVSQRLRHLDKRDTINEILTRNEKWNREGKQEDYR